MERNWKDILVEKQWDEHRQVIAVMGSDSWVLQACKWCTKVQTLPTSHLLHSWRHQNPASLDRVTPVRPSHSFRRLITSDRRRAVYIKKKEPEIHNIGFFSTSLNESAHCIGFAGAPASRVASALREVCVDSALALRSGGQRLQLQMRKMNCWKRKTAEIVSVKLTHFYGGNQKSLRRVGWVLDTFCSVVANCKSGPLVEGWGMTDKLCGPFKWNH